MAITTVNEKLAAMEWCSVWEPSLPISPGTLGTDDLQQLLWGYPSVAWGEPVIVTTRNKGSGLTEEEYYRLEAQLIKEQKRIRRMNNIRRDDDEIISLIVS